MTTRWIAALAITLSFVCMAPTHSALAAEGKNAGDEKKAEFNLPPFPADKTIKQSTTIDGRKLSYDATVGSLPVLDDKGKKIAEVMFIAYTVPGKDRPDPLEQGGFALSRPLASLVIATAMILCVIAFPQKPGQCRKGVN